MAQADDEHFCAFGEDFSFAQFAVGKWLICFFRGHVGVADGCRAAPGKADSNSSFRTLPLRGWVMIILGMALRKEMS